MKMPEEELKEIKTLCKDAELVDFSGKKIVFLPKVRFNTRSGEVVRNLIFVPFPHSGYDNRLFFSEVVNSGGAQNWKSFELMNRSWWSLSFRVNTSMSWLQQILCHIDAVV